MAVGRRDDPQPVQHVLGLVHSRVLHDDLVGGQGMGDAASNDNRNQPRCVKGPWTQHWYPSR